MNDNDRYLKETELRRAREYNARRNYWEKAGRQSNRTGMGCLIVFVIVVIAIVVIEAFSYNNQRKVDDYIQEHPEYNLESW